MWNTDREAIAELARKYPSEAFNELFQAMDKIERKYVLLYKLTKSERIAIEESLRDGQVATAEEVEEAFRHFRRPPKGKVSRK